MATEKQIELIRQMCGTPEGDSHYTPPGALAKYLGVPELGELSKDAASELIETMMDDDARHELRENVLNQDMERLV